MNAVVSSTKNWEALLELQFRATEQKTRMVPIRRYGPLSVQRAFYPEQDLCHTYLLHPPGGVVGGDRLDLKVLADSNSHSLITTPGATKFYYSAGQTATVQQNLTLNENSSLEFFPHENIYFPGAEVKSKTSLQLSKESSVMLWEKHCFGRPTNDEKFDTGKVITQMDVNVEQDLVFTDTQRFDEKEINRACGLRGYPVCGTFMISAPGINKNIIEQCRAIESADAFFGITQPLESLLVIRYMGHSTMLLNQYFIQLWTLLRPLFLNRPACHPRIWKT